jgi:hypothetical protein
MYIALQKNQDFFSCVPAELSAVGRMFLFYNAKSNVISFVCDRFAAAFRCPSATESAIKPPETAPAFQG